MAVSELPGNPNAVWTVKKNVDGRSQIIFKAYYGVIFMFLFTDKHDAYIVVSFVNATLVLAIGETVEEANDSGFMATTPTLGCGIIGDDSLLQVGPFQDLDWLRTNHKAVVVQIYPEGIRHIRSDRRVNEWKTPGKRQIVKCAMNRFVVLLPQICQKSAFLSGPQITLPGFRRQVAVALAGGELVYFELDPVGFGKFFQYSDSFTISFHTCRPVS